MSGADVDAALAAAQLAREPHVSVLRSALVHTIAALRYFAPPMTSTNATAGEIFDACAGTALNVRTAVISLVTALGGEPA